MRQCKVGFKVILLVRDSLLSIGRGGMGCISTVSRHRLWHGDTGYGPVSKSVVVLAYIAVYLLPIAGTGVRMSGVGQTGCSTLFGQRGAIASTVL